MRITVHLISEQIMCLKTIAVFWPLISVKNRGFFTPVIKFMLIPGCLLLRDQLILVYLGSFLII